MTLRIALLMLSATIALGSVACTKEVKPDPKPAAPECKLVGDWEIKANDGDEADKKVSASFKLDNTKDKIASGSMTLGNLEIKETTIISSPADVKAIEGGTASTVTWDYLVGEGNHKSEECKLAFVDNCGALTFDCPSRNFKLTRVAAEKKKKAE